MGFTINTVSLDGNLTRDPELRDAGAAKVCGFRIAHNARKKVQGEWADVPYYFDVQLWQGQGEWFAANASKGDRVVVQGRLEWREWEKDGEKRQAVSITAENVVLLSRGGGGSSSTSAGSFSAPTANGSDLPPAAPDDFVPSGASGPEDDIPFAWEGTQTYERAKYHSAR